MKLSQFDELRLRAQELTGGKEYPDNAVVEGLFNRTELLIQRIPDVQLKDNLVRMFNEIKHRNRPYNNTQKLLALENFCDTVINGVDAERLMRNPTQFFNLNDAIMKAKKTRGNSSPVRDNESDSLSEYFPEFARRAAKLEQDKDVSAIRQILEHPLSKWVGGILTAVLVGYLLYLLGLN